MIVFVLLVTCNNVNVYAQTLEAISHQRILLEGTPQITAGYRPTDIQINQATNKIYVANGASNSVTVIDGNSGNISSIGVGLGPESIAIDEYRDKIYVGNTISNTVSVIDGYSNIRVKEIQVGAGPRDIVWNQFGNIYVANAWSNTVSVISDNNDTVVRTIPVRIDPVQMVGGGDKIYVANAGSNSISVINGTTDTLSQEIPVGKDPKYLMVEYEPGWYGFKIYVANAGSNSISVINGTTDTKERPDIPLGIKPVAIASSEHKIFVAGYKELISQGRGFISVINAINDTKEPHDIPLGPISFSPDELSIRSANGYIYLTNAGSNTVSIINPLYYKNQDIRVGLFPVRTAYNIYTNMIYVANRGGFLGAERIPGTVSVIDGSAGKLQLAAGVIFNINPAFSGKILCNDVVYPTNIYLYVDFETKCMAQPDKYYYYDGWIEKNQRYTIPLDSPGNLTVYGYGTFTANFKPLNFIPPPPPPPPDYTFLLMGVLATIIIGWSWTSIVGWLKTRTQYKHLKECIKQIGTLDKNAIEDKMKEYYLEGKISEAHRQFLKDKISEYYGRMKG
jgi:YVTN family beta-propeller protein